MGIHGLLRNLHALLVPPSTHQSCQEKNGNSHGNGNNNIQRTNKNSPRHNIRQFANKSIAVDASSWLHKAGYTCADRLVEATENKARDAVAEKRYTDYMLKRCDELLNIAKISTIYLVFDGVRVPLKSGTNAEREARRKANLEEARRLMAEGRTEEAKDKYRACVKGTAEMAQVVAGAVMERWGKHGENAKVKCVFSPYEADAQLAKLCADGITHAVVTEDSDVLVYSAVCRRPFPIIYKLDKTDGSCDVVTMDWLLNPEYLPPSSKSRSRRRRRDWERSPDKKSKPEIEAKHASEIDYDDLGLAPVRRQLPPPTIGKSSNPCSARSKSSKADSGGPGAALLSCLRSFVSKEACSPGAGVRLFVQACVLSGCDYVSNRLTKVGPVKSFQLVKDVSHRQPHVRFERLLKSLPNGCRLLPEEGDKNTSENGRDEDDSDDFNDEFPSSGLNIEDDKKKYEELLSKSEAVFYYHLVKSISNGEIMPLVPHKPIESHNDEQGAPSDYSPDIKHFDPKLMFLGSAEEALANELRLLPSIAKNSLSQQQWHQKTQRHNKWIDTSKKTFPPANRVHQASSVHRKSYLPRINAILNSFSKTPSLIRNVNSSSTVTSSCLSSTIKINMNSSSNRLKPSNFMSVARKSPPRKNQLNKTNTARNTSDQFSSYACGTKTLYHQHESSASPFHVATSNGSHRNKAMSPLFSPGRKMDDFDYGETPSRNETIPSTQSRHFANRGKDSMSDLKQAFDVHLDSTVDSSSKAGDHHQHKVEQDNSAKKNHFVSYENDLRNEENTFDYNQIIPESPPMLSRASTSTTASKYFCRTAGENDLFRRISASPPEQFKFTCKDESAEGRSPDDAIELSDADGSEDELIITENNENHARNIRTTRLVMNNNSVNKRPFMSPYLKSKPYTTNSHKRIRTTLSGPPHAGFQRQNELKQIGTHQSHEFNPTATLKNCINRNKKKTSLPGKRPKGTPSLLSFMSSKRKNHDSLHS